MNSDWSLRRAAVSTSRTNGFSDKKDWKTDKQCVLQGDFARGRMERERYTLSFVVEKTNG